MPTIIVGTVAALAYLPVRFARNSIIQPVAHPVTVDPDALRYYGDLYVAGDLVCTLEAAGRPPVEVGALMVYEGADLFIDSAINSVLKYNRPSYGQSAIVLCPDVIKPFYVESRISNVVSIGSVLPGNVVEVHPAQYALKAGLNYEDYPSYPNEEFFTLYQLLQKQFLTWQPDDKLTDENCPEHLYFLVNFTPLPTEMRLKVRVFYEDGLYEDLQKGVVLAPVQYSVYNFPVGFSALGLASLPKKIEKYAVWLSNEVDSLISEVRTFVLDKRVRRNVNYFIFQNSLGGYDTIRCVGAYFENAAASSEVVGKRLPFDYVVTMGESVTTETGLERELTVSTGFISRQHITYLQELYLSKDIYFVSDRDLLPVERVAKSFKVKDSQEDLRGVKLQFKFSYVNRLYSALPAKAVVQKLYYNDLIEGLVSKQCGVGETTVPVNYQVLANSFSSTRSKPIAQALAQKHFDDTKQAYANQNGVCTAPVVPVITYGWNTYYSCVQIENQGNVENNGKARKHLFTKTVDGVSTGFTMLQNYGAAYDGYANAISTVNYKFANASFLANIDTAGYEALVDNFLINCGVNDQDRPALVAAAEFEDASNCPAPVVVQPDVYLATIVPYKIEARETYVGSPSWEYKIWVQRTNSTVNGQPSKNFAFAYFYQIRDFMNSTNVTQWNNALCESGDEYDIFTLTAAPSHPNGIRLYIVSVPENFGGLDTFVTGTFMESGVFTTQPTN